MITTFLFDLDGTLYDRDALVKALAVEQYRAFRHELRHVDRGRYVGRLIELDEHGYKPKGEVYAQLAVDYGLSRLVQARLHDHFWVTYDAYCVLASDTLHTLDTLQKRGIKLGVVTNGGTNRQNSKIDALRIRPYFHAIAISEAEGVRKPDPDIFLRILDKCGSSPAEALHVGDHPRDDIEGALNAGLSAAWKAVPYWRMDRLQVPRIEKLSDVLSIAGISG